MIGKIHNNQGHTILAVCDKEHLGKKFEDEKLEFNASEKFFGNEEINEEELINMANEVTSINLFGDKCVEILQREGLISESSVIFIKGIKHAQIYQI
jgi:hypothetical protein